MQEIKNMKKWSPSQIIKKMQVKNYHFINDRFSILNKIVIIYLMLVRMRKLTLSHIAGRNVNLLNLMVGNLVTYIRSVCNCHPMIFSLKYSTGALGWAQT